MSQFTIFRSTDSGAPVLTGQTGKLVDMLDAILVNGYTASVTSITRSGTTATVTCATAHGFNTGNQTTIAGANESDYNGTFTVTVTSATVFTITVGGSPATPATGTITWKKLAAGWTKAFSGSSKAAYRQGGGNQFYLRVRDDGPNGSSTFREAWVRGYETMSDVDTGTGLFPTVAQVTNGGVVRKSTTADATARAWIVVADDRTFYLFTFSGDTANAAHLIMFGDIYSYVGSSDGYRTMLIANELENSGASNACPFPFLVSSLATANGMHYIARSYLGTGTSVNVGKHTDHVKNGAGSTIGGASNSISFPNAPDGGFYLAPLWIHDPTTSPLKTIRGVLRGVWNPCHAGTNFTDGDTFSGTGDMAGKSFLVVKSLLGGGASTALVVVETSNTLLTN